VQENNFGSKTGALTAAEYQLINGEEFKRNLTKKSFYGSYARFVKFIGKTILPKYKSAVDEYNEPVVYICRHLNMHGPFVTINAFHNIHPLILSSYFSVKDCYKLYMEYTFKVRMKWNKLFSAMMATICSMLVVPLIRSFKAVPVYRGIKMNIMKTFRIGNKFLLSGESLIVYPDINYTEGYDSKCDIYSGFLLLGKQYFLSTGKKLKFIPLIIDDNNKVIYSKSYFEWNGTSDDINLLKENIKKAIQAG